MKKNSLYLFFIFGLIAVLSLSSLNFKKKRISEIDYIPADTIKFNVPKGWPKPIYDFKENPLTESKVKLGRKLFYDPMLSKDSTISCSTCHLSYTNFTHIDHALSHGIDGKIGNRNTLSIINSAWQTTFMWDGGINHIEVQPLAPLTSAVEMESSLPIVVDRIKNIGEYRALFEIAFGSSEITGQRVLKALSQFMLTFTSSNSKYDKVMRQEIGVKFSESEQKGYDLFKQNCASCHKEPLFTSQSFENNGLEVDTLLNDFGRMKITKNPKDSIKFRVPTLRNIEVSYPYMHDGRYRNLQMVIFHYTNNIKNSSTLSPQLKNKMLLSEIDKRNLIAFLKTLTDVSFLRNKDFAYPR